MTKQLRILVFMLSFSFFTVFLFPSAASALETQDGDPCVVGETGWVRTTGVPENAGVSEILICNGTIWEAQSGLSGPAGCANIGDLCADGTVFAGWHPITYAHLFIPTVDQGTTSAWKTSTGTDDIATDSTYDGRINTNQVANSTTFSAFKLCKDLGTGGHSDWYLPSQVELYYLWSVHETIEAGGNITNFQNALYRSSTEYLINEAWYQNFSNGTQGKNTKTNDYRVRCVRR